MLGFGVCDRIKSPATHDSVLRIVGVAKCTEDTAEVGFQPKCVRCGTFRAALVNGVSFYAPGDPDLDAHINTRECIVTAGKIPRWSISDQCMDHPRGALKMARTSKSRL